ncbi:MAG TPA: carboxymuconolactone decarboxylase family protein [Gammaproteobacteria bacterium]|jgi:alkyl hydroperoxide reductase subunit D|nr:carboxymuconolactone decarboxylase family protein [Gammaproteobacteria bacterium]
MTLQNILENFPSYAKDIKLNLSSLLQNNTLLSEQQFYGNLLVSAYASKNKVLTEAIFELCKDKLSENAIEAVKAAAALMAMNNIYYRFTHLSSNEDYAKMPANLRMSVMANPGIDKNDFELFSLAVSIINGCGKCIDAHEKVLLTHGMSKDKIQQTARIASIVHAAGFVVS